MSKQHTFSTYNAKSHLTKTMSQMYDGYKVTKWDFYLDIMIISLLQINQISEVVKKLILVV